MSTSSNSNPVQSHGPLTGVRVIDLGHYLAGPLAGMLLSDQGAEVIKVDPPAGPTWTHPVNSMLNRGKKRISLDLKTPAGASALAELISKSDVLIENFRPKVLSKLGFDLSRLQSLNSRLIIISLPGFSQTDVHYRDIRAWEGIVAAMSGQYTNIHAFRALLGLNPVYTALPMASIYAAVHGATAVALGLIARKKTGCGGHYECSLAGASLSAMTSIHMHVENQPLRYDIPKIPRFIRRTILPILRKVVSRSSTQTHKKIAAIGRKAYPALMRSYLCADGKLLYLFAIDHGPIVVKLLSHLQLLDRLRAEGLQMENPYEVVSDQNLEDSSNLSKAWQGRISDQLSEVLLERPAEDWEVRLNKIGVPCSCQRSTAEWMALPELLSAGLMIELPDPILGTVRQPGVQVMIRSSQPTQDQPMPVRQLDADRAQVLNLPLEATQESLDEDPECAKELPLTGLRVLDLCSMVAGPVAGRSLAEYGAEVIKVETPNPHHGPRMTNWYGLDVNQGKRSVLIDLKTEEGQAVLHDLVTGVDVLIHNCRPNAAENLGLRDEVLHAINPSLVISVLNAYNGPRPGPWDDRPGYDPVLQAASGIMTRYGSAEAPELHAIASCIDALAGYSAAFGITAALYRRDHGTRMDTSLAQAASLIQAPYALSHEGADVLPEAASGQEASGEHALYRIYRAKDGWFFLGARPSDLTRLPSELHEENGSGCDGSSDNRLAEHLVLKFRAMTLKHCLKCLNDADLSAVEVLSVEAMRESLLATGDDASMRLIRREVDELGAVISASPMQIKYLGSALSPATPARKPGADTNNIVPSAESLIKKGILSSSLSDAFLPQ